MRDVDELHDALLILGLLPGDAASKSATDESQFEAWLQELTTAGRAYRLELTDGVFGWAPAERLPWLRLVYPQSVIEPGPPDMSLPAETTREDAVLSLVRGWVECIGPFTAGGISRTLSLPASDVAYAVAQLENDGAVLRGSFTPGADQEEFCDRRILARIHRSTIDSLRSQVEPVPPATFVRFLLQWQHVDLPSRLSGEGGLLAVIEELQGLKSPPPLLRKRFSRRG